MRSRRSFGAAAVAAVVALAGPWVSARADDWPAPDGDPYAGHGVILADIALPSIGAVGFRVTLPTGGEIDSLGWIDSSAAAPDDMVALGESDWDVSDPTTGPSGSGVTIWSVGGSDVRVEESGVTVIDRRGDDQSDTWLENGVGIGGYPAGTYDIVLWGATSAPSAITRFRLHAPADATLVDETTSSSAFLRTQRQFTGTAGATVDAQPVTATVPVWGGPPPPVGAAASVDESTSVSIDNSLYGAFVIPPGTLLFSSPSGQPVPFGSYTGPTGTQDVSGVEWLSGEPAGAYTFTLDEYAGPQAYVTGADLTTP